MEIPFFGGNFVSIGIKISLSSQKERSFFIFHGGGIRAVPKVSDEHVQARKKQILAAAALRFSRKGFHRTTIQDICEEASLSPGAIYRYFSGKGKIITAMAEEKMLRNLAAIKSVKESMDGDMGKTFEELAKSFFGGLEKDSKDSLRLDVELWAEALRDPRVLKFVRNSVDTQVGSLAEMIKSAQERGTFSNDVDALAVAQILASLFRGMILLKSMDDTVNVGEYVKTVLTMVRSLVKRKGQEI
jgi:AcrR family transcriptional regulator